MIKRPIMFRWYSFYAGICILLFCILRGHFHAGWLMAAPWLKEAIKHI